MNLEPLALVDCRPGDINEYPAKSRLFLICSPGAICVAIDSCFRYLIGEVLYGFWEVMRHQRLGLLPFSG